MNDKLILVGGLVLQLIILLVTLTWSLGELKSDFTIQLLKVQSDVQTRISQLSSELTLVKTSNENFQVQQQKESDRLGIQLLGKIDQNAELISVLQENCAEIQKRHAIEDSRGRQK